MNYSDVIVIVTILALSIYLSFVTAMFWDFTHDSHSYGILILSCASAALGNTSVMVFFSYASDKNIPYCKFAMGVGYCMYYTEKNIIILTLILALSGFLACILGLIQDVYHSGAIRFSPDIFFIIITSIIVVLSVVFIIFEYTTLKIEENISKDRAVSLIKQKMIQYRLKNIIEKSIS